MRKCGLFFLLLVFVLAFNTAGCTDKAPSQADSTSVADSLQADSLNAEDSVIAEQPMPKAADELFDDFFFNFAANRKLQRERIDFPLKVYNNGTLVKQIQKKDWVMNHFFMRQDYYTLIFDNQRQLDLVKDTAVGNVIVEKIYLTKNRVDQFCFNRVNGEFRMTKIDHKTFNQTKNASFFHFYQRFSRDSLFQIESMNDEVTFTSPNPDNDFENQTGVILPEQWPYFKPGLIPRNVIYNIIYGQRYTESNQKVFVIRGIANGMEIEMTFRKKGVHWKLIKFNT